VVRARGRGTLGARGGAACHALRVTAAVCCDEVTKRFGATLAIDRLSLEVETGEVLGFLGPNGAGKSTTIRLLLDLLRPTAGAVQVLGSDPRRAGAQLRRRIGYLPGDLSLYDKLTGVQLLTYLTHLRRDHDIVHGHELAERFACDLSKPIGSLSRGNRQKVGIVQAFMHRPELLVLDEPTSGLDPIMQREFRALLREVRTDGTTVFLSSHVLAEVQRAVDRVAIVREGRLVAVDHVREIEAKALRVVEIRFGAPVRAQSFEGLPGVRSVTVEGDLLRASVAGSADALVKAAARFEVESIAGHEADLEDVFLAYYDNTTEKGHEA
jgi:ABC-2 type transport system ATP-binding protein